MSLPFTAQNLLTGFTWKMSDLLWKNETDRRDPYFLYPPKQGTASGYAFGAVQWDIPNFSPFDNSLDRADKIFEDILLNAKDANGLRIIDNATVASIINTTTKTGLAYTKGSDTILNPYITRINQALDSTYGRQKIDAEHVTYINAIVRWVNDTVTLTTNPADNTYLANSEVAQLFIGDLRNQYGAPRNNNLRAFLQGQAVNMTLGNQASTVTKVGRLGMDDILNFYFAIPANVGPADKLRRFNGIVSVTGGYYALPADPTAREEEAKGLLRVYQDYLKGKEAPLGNNFTTFNANVLEFARVTLIATYVTNPALGISVTINGDVIVGEDTTSYQRNNKHRSDTDILTGTTNNDLIFGESGTDLLDGAQGSDVLHGGTPASTFIVSAPGTATTL